MSRKLPPWLALRKKSMPEPPLEPPIALGFRCNGEFYLEPSAQERRIRAEILRRADEKARRLDMDRRAFLASAMGMTTSLGVLNLASGCGDESGNTRSDSGKPLGDGGFTVSDASTLDAGCATEILSGRELIIDTHTHLIEDEETWRTHHPMGAYPGDSLAARLTFFDCTPIMPSRPSDCVGPAQYLELIFLGSETSVAVLTGYPSELCDDGTFCTNALGNEDRVRVRDEFNAAARSQRVIQHCQVAPNDNWPKQRDTMQRISEEAGNWGWKCYPPWGPNGIGYRLDDETVTGPLYAEIRELAARQKTNGRGLGRPVLCAHKGVILPELGFDAANADPSDVGPAAVANPDIAFLVYHSGYEIGRPEGPYDPADPNPGGVDRLVRTVEQHGLRGKNVYADLGVAWAIARGDPIGAQHMLGKLLKYLGEDRVLYGSECLWFGSPQTQIEALRTLQISAEFQEHYGYPALTPEIKAKVLGLNAASVYGLDPAAVRCEVDASKLARQKALLDGELGSRRWTLQPPLGPSSRREFLRLLKWRKFLGVPA